MFAIVAGVSSWQLLEIFHSDGIMVATVVRLDNEFGGGAGGIIDKPETTCLSVEIFYNPAWKLSRLAAAAHTGRI